MTTSEAIDKIKNDGNWTEDNFEIIKKAVDNSEFTDFTDPEFKKFMSFINKWDYYEKIQKLVTSIIVKFTEKGISSPCGGDCGSCAFHEMEFGDV